MRLENNDDKCVMVLCGWLAELMVKVTPNMYGPHAWWNKKDELIIYVHLQNALYGIMHVTLLFYEHFCTDISTISFFNQSI